MSVLGAHFMPVLELCLLAGTIAGLDPSSLHLMHGEFLLRLDSVLGDHPALIGPHGMRLTVVSSSGSPTRAIVRSTSLDSMGRPPPPSDLPRPVFVSAHPPLTPPSINPFGITSFLILVIFEDGSTMMPVV